MNEDYVLTLRREDFELGDLANAAITDARVNVSDRASAVSPGSGRVRPQEFGFGGGAKVESNVLKRKRRIVSPTEGAAASLLTKARATVVTLTRRSALSGAKNVVAKARARLGSRLASSVHGDSLPTGGDQRSTSVIHAERTAKDNSFSPPDKSGLLLSQLKPENIIVTCSATKTCDAAHESENTQSIDYKKHESTRLIREKIFKSTPKALINKEKDGKGIEISKEHHLTDAESGEDISTDSQSTESKKSKRELSRSEKSRNYKSKTSKSPDFDKWPEHGTSPYDPFFDDTRFFMIKSGNEENVILSKVKGVWATTPRNEELLNKAYRKHRNVILVFSVEKSQAFQGFCRMISESTDKGSPVNWVLPRGMSGRALGGVFRVQWLNRSELAFGEISRRLTNPWNGDKPLKIARDGTEIAPRVGQLLCRQFPLDGSVDLDDAVQRMREHRFSTSAAANVIRRPLTPPPRRLRPAPASYPDRRRHIPSPPRRPAFAAGRDRPAVQRRRLSPPRSRPFVDPRVSRRQIPPPRPRPPIDYRMRGRRRSPSDTAIGYKDLLINGSYSDYIRQYSSSSAPYSTSAANNALSLLTSLPASYAYPPTDPYSAYFNYYNAATQYLETGRGSRIGSTGLKLNKASTAFLTRNDPRRSPLPQRPRRQLSRSPVRRSDAGGGRRRRTPSRSRSSGSSSATATTSAKVRGRRRRS